MPDVKINKFRSLRTIHQTGYARVPVLSPIFNRKASEVQVCGSRKSLARDLQNSYSSTRADALIDIKLDTQGVSVYVYCRTCSISLISSQSISIYTLSFGSLWFTNYLSYLLRQCEKTEYQQFPIEEVRQIRRK